MLKNAYLDAKIGFDPAENEPRKEWSVCFSLAEMQLRLQGRILRTVALERLEQDVRRVAYVALAQEDLGDAALVY